MCGWVLISSENVLYRIYSITESFSVEILAKKPFLVINNASPNPKEELKNGEIKAVFLPPNINSLSNLWIRVWVKCWKRNTVTSFYFATLEKINIKVVVYWMAQTREETETITLEKSRWKLLLVMKMTVSAIQCKKTDTLVPLLHLIPGSQTVNNEEVQGRMNEDEEQELTVIHY